MDSQHLWVNPKGFLNLTWPHRGLLGCFLHVQSLDYFKKASGPANVDECSWSNIQNFSCFPCSRSGPTSLLGVTAFSGSPTQRHTSTAPPMVSSTPRWHFGLPWMWSQLDHWHLHLQASPHLLFHTTMRLLHVLWGGWESLGQPAVHPSSMGAHWSICILLLLLLGEG